MDYYFLDTQYFPIKIPYLINVYFLEGDLKVDMSYSDEVLNRRYILDKC